MTKKIAVYEVYDNHYINKESAEYVIENYGNGLEPITVKEWDGKVEVYIVAGDEQIELDMDSRQTLSQD